MRLRSEVKSETTRVTSFASSMIFKASSMSPSISMVTKRRASPVFNCEMYACGLSSQATMSCGKTFLEALNVLMRLAIAVSSRKPCFKLLALFATRASCAKAAERARGFSAAALRRFAAAAARDFMLAIALKVLSIGLPNQSPYTSMRDTPVLAASSFRYTMERVEPSRTLRAPYLKENKVTGFHTVP